MNLYFCKPISPEGFFACNLIRKLTTYLLLLVCYTSAAQESGDTGKPLVSGSDRVQDTLLLRKTILHTDSLNTDSLSLKPDSISVNDSIPNDSTSRVEQMVLEAPISYNAVDSIVVALDNKKVFLYKDAVVTYQDIELKADYIELDMNSKEVYAEGVPDTAGVIQGEPVFTQGTDEFDSKT